MSRIEGGRRIDGIEESVDASIQGQKENFKRAKKD